MLVLRACLCASFIMFVPHMCMATSVLFQDNFDGGTATGWTQYDGVFSVVGGEYSISSTGFANDARAVSNVGNNFWTDYTLDVDYYLANTGTSNWPSSVLFHVMEVASGVDAGKYYEFRLGPNLVGFDKINYSGGFGTVLVERNYSVGTTGWHHLRLYIAGQTATAFIDGSEVLNCNSLVDFSYGGIGLKSINSSTTVFDNVVVSGGVVPEPVTMLGLFLGLGGLGRYVVSRRRQS